METKTSNLVDTCRLIVVSTSRRWQIIPESAWWGHLNHLNFGGHQPYLWNGWSYCGQILYACRLCRIPAYWWQICCLIHRSTSAYMVYYSREGSVQSHVTSLNIWGKIETWLQWKFSRKSYVAYGPFRRWPVCNFDTIISQQLKQQMSNFVCG